MVVLRGGRRMQGYWLCVALCVTLASSYVVQTSLAALLINPHPDAGPLLRRSGTAGQSSSNSLTHQTLPRRVPEPQPAGIHHTKQPFIGRPTHRPIDFVLANLPPNSRADVINTDASKQAQHGQQQSTAQSVSASTGAGMMRGEGEYLPVSDKLMTNADGKVAGSGEHGDEAEHVVHLRKLADDASGGQAKSGMPSYYDFQAAVLKFTNEKWTRKGAKSPPKPKPSTAGYSGSNTATKDAEKTLSVPAPVPLPVPVPVPVPSPVRYPVPSPRRIPVPSPVRYPVPSPRPIPVPSPVRSPIPVPSPAPVRVPSPVRSPPVRKPPSPSYRQTPGTLAGSTTNTRTATADEIHSSATAQAALPRSDRHEAKPGTALTNNAATRTGTTSDVANMQADKGFAQDNNPGANVGSNAAGQRAGAGVGGGSSLDTPLPGVGSRSPLSPQIVTGGMVGGKGVPLPVTTTTPGNSSASPATGGGAGVQTAVEPSAGSKPNTPSPTVATDEDYSDDTTGGKGSGAVGTKGSESKTAANTTVSGQVGTAPTTADSSASGSTVSGSTDSGSAASGTGVQGKEKKKAIPGWVWASFMVPIGAVIVVGLIILYLKCGDHLCCGASRRRSYRRHQTFKDEHANNAFLISSRASSGSFGKESTGIFSAPNPHSSYSCTSSHRKGHSSGELQSKSSLRSHQKNHSTTTATTEEEYRNPMYNPLHQPLPNPKEEDIVANGPNSPKTPAQPVKVGPANIHVNPIHTVVLNQDPDTQEGFMHAAATRMFFNPLVDDPNTPKDGRAADDNMMPRMVPIARTVTKDSETGLTPTGLTPTYAAMPFRNNNLMREDSTTGLTPHAGAQPDSHIVMMNNPLGPAGGSEGTNPFDNSLVYSHEIQQVMARHQQGPYTNHSSALVRALDASKARMNNGF